MGAPDLSRVLTIVALSWLMTACSGAPEPSFGEQPTEAKAEIERTKDAAESGEAAALPTEPDPGVEPVVPAEGETQPTSDPAAPKRFATQSVEEPPPPPTLFQAAEAERKRRQETTRSSVVITNANLDDYAKEGNLTELVTEGVGEPADTGSVEEDEVEPETYWRTKVRDARLAWRAASDRAAELEKEVAQLRYDFYAQDDPFVRDSEIKPAWDRAAVEVAQAHLHAKDLQAAVERTLEEGRQAGALPGWLREGIDFEPQRAEEPSEEDVESPAAAQIIEPPILEEPPS